MVWYVVCGGFSLKYTCSSGTEVTSKDAHLLLLLCMRVHVRVRVHNVYFICIGVILAKVWYIFQILTLNDSCLD